MNFWRSKKKKPEISQTVDKRDVLEGLKQRCNYFKNYSENNHLFTPEYETAKAINSILEENEILNEADTRRILNLLNEIDKIEHFDGSGWYDYQIRTAYFLKMSGFETEIIDRKLYLVAK